MNGFLTAAIAHDSTCKPGEEWLFHGMAGPHDVHVSTESPIEPKDKELLDKDMTEFRKRDEKLNKEMKADSDAFGCIMAFVFVAFLIGVAIWALA